MPEYVIMYLWQTFDDLVRTVDRECQVFFF